MGIIWVPTRYHGKFFLKKKSNMGISKNETPNFACVSFFGMFTYRVTSCIMMSKYINTMA